MWRTEPFSRSHEAAPCATTTTTRTTATSGTLHFSSSSVVSSPFIRKDYPSRIEIRFQSSRNLIRRSNEITARDFFDISRVVDLKVRCAPKRMVLTEHATWVVNRGVVVESIINGKERVWQRNEVPSLQEIKSRRNDSR